MPLQDLVSYFNRENARHYGVLRGIDQPLDQTAERRVQGHFADLLLSSTFQPVFRSRARQPIGYEGLLRASGAKGRVRSPASVFMLPFDANEAIHLDRLCRTLHALNFLLAEPDPSVCLFLNVHPRLLAEVTADHGVAFEGILRQLGLDPGRIVLELPASARQSVGHLDQALEGYRARGYRVAFDGVTVEPQTVEELLKFTPDFLKLDFRYGPLPAFSDVIAAFEAISATQTAAIAVGATYNMMPYLENLGIRLFQGNALAPASDELVAALNRW